MSSSDFAEELVAGAVGPPGHRTFYLRVRLQGADTWYLMEKGQVAALAEQVLALLPEAEDEPLAPALGEPAEPAFRVGSLAVGFQDGVFTFLLESTDEAAGLTATFRADADRVRAMAAEALRVVAAGRPLCRFCNLPIDPDGHVCPAGNGDRRRAAP